MRRVICIAALLLSACGGGGSPLSSAQAQAPKPLIVAIGDSITAGYMPGDGARNRLAQDQAYTAELRPLGQFVTAAVGGATTEAARLNQLWWLSPLSPAVVVVMLGTNDAVLGYSRETALANVTTIVQAWPRAKVVLISPPRWDDARDPWMSAWSADLQRLASASGAQFVDAYAASLAAPWQCSAEDHHPCADAHRQLGRMVATAVQAALQKG